MQTVKWELLFDILSIDFTDDSGSNYKSSKDLSSKKGDSRYTYNNKMGIALFDSHESIGKLRGKDLPKFGEIGWPPPFRTTVRIMRDFIEDNCGKFERWTAGTFKFHKGYFNRVFGLHKTKVRTKISKVKCLYHQSIN